MADFNQFVPILLEAEGGYQNKASDKRGNSNSLGQMVGTNLGISAPVYEKWLGYPPSVSDMKSITVPVALEIYEAWYWNAVLASKINDQAVAETLVDHTINGGEGGAARIMQQVLRKEFGLNVAIDGDVGPKTVAAINSVNPRDLFQIFSQYRLEAYKAINNPDWQAGWKKRVFKYAKKFGIVLKKKMYSPEH